MDTKDRHRMMEPLGPRGKAARDEQAAALRRNPYLDHVTLNKFEERIAFGDWQDDHHGQNAPGFKRPAPKFTERHDFGNLPYRVLHWPEHGGKVKAFDFWTGNRARQFALFAEICERKVKVLHYPALDPKGLMPLSPCWHPNCVLGMCLGVAHVDEAGNVWEQPPRALWNEALRQWELPENADRLATP